MRRIVPSVALSIALLVSIDPAPAQESTPRGTGTETAPLDIDGDAQTQALTDGLLVLRFLFGLEGAALVSGAVDLGNCSRCTAPEIEDYLENLAALLLSCQAGAFDLNGFFEDGCEHVLDTGGIYVSIGDAAALDDSTCGLGPAGTAVGNYPCRTIGQGIARATALGRPRVLVANGIYLEAVTMVNGRSLLGGHDPETWERGVATTATIVRGTSSIGNHDRAVVASGITSSTIFEGFVVIGPTNGKPAGNSYAIYVSGSDGDLSIENNVVLAGRGGPGGVGAGGGNGAGGVDGGGRADSPAGYDAKIATGAGFCDATNNRTLANGGARTCGGDNVGGGSGGGNVCPPSSTLIELSGQDGAMGQPGVGAGGGAAGAGADAGDDMRLENSGAVCIVPAGLTDGQAGADGSIGAHGAAASGCADVPGTVAGGHWSGDAGGAGPNGSNGGGGGGGGGGAGGFCLSCAENKDRLGGHGGGGGSGACGGMGGGGASAGGGAFGIFVSAGAPPVITGNTISSGEGGPGGIGGNGGAGGLGGDGGLGGVAIFCTGSGGEGGGGGDGGHGAGGGGGCGGISYAIYTFGVGMPTYCDMDDGNTFIPGVPGAGGAGGASLANPGGAGATGVTGNCSFN